MASDAGIGSSAWVGGLNLAFYAGGVGLVRAVML